MVRRGVVDLDTQGGGQVRPQARGELGASIGGYYIGHAVAGDPVVERII